MLLEIDAGNTRVKWRLTEVRNGTPVKMSSDGDFTMPGNTTEGDECFCKAVAGKIANAVVERVLISNVRGVGFRKNFTEFAKDAWGMVPEFANSTNYCAGVTNGYTEPDKLGVDRWLAILAAYNMAKTDCCILNCGTTITFDIVSGEGKHEGGYIVPGLQLMRDSLFSKSPVLVANPESANSLSPGHDTSAAINNGIFSAIIGFVTAMKSAQSLIKSQSVWFVSGGDGEIISRHLAWETRLCPSLVLDGLTLALP